jgi:hypothetical protein
MPEPEWTILRYANSGYNVDCGYCLTSWRGVGHTNEHAEKFLAEHQWLYCPARNKRLAADGPKEQP